MEPMLVAYGLKGVVVLCLYLGKRIASSLEKVFILSIFIFGF